MSRKINETFVEVACAGCGRTQRVRASKVIPCDGYTCSLGRCKQNPDFKPPEVLDGWICVHESHAAGGSQVGQSVLQRKRKNVPSSEQKLFGMQD